MSVEQDIQARNDRFVRNGIAFGQKSRKLSDFINKISIVYSLELEVDCNLMEFV